MEKTKCLLNTGRGFILALAITCASGLYAAENGVGRIPDGVYGCYGDSVGWQGAGGTVKFSPGGRNGQIKITGSSYQVHEAVGKFQQAGDGKITWQGGYYSKGTEARYGLSSKGDPAIFLWWPDVKTGLRCLRGAVICNDKIFKISLHGLSAAFHGWHRLG